MPKYYFFKNQPFNEKRTVQKWTLVSIFLIFICMDKIKEELKTVPLLYNLYGFIRFKKKVLFCCFFGII